jgi:hypothetical protein
MTAELRLPPKLYSSIWSHLLQDDREQVAFGFAEVKSQRVLAIDDAYLVQPDEFLSHFGYHVALTDEVQGKVIKRAWDSKRALVEFHSHLDGRFEAQFSDSDIGGFADWVPHVRWRLKGSPYVAIVVSPGSFDALSWSESVPTALGCLNTGSATLKPTNRTQRYLDERARRSI